LLLQTDLLVLKYIPHYQLTSFPQRFPATALPRHQEHGAFPVGIPEFVSMVDWENGDVTDKSEIMAEKLTVKFTEMTDKLKG